MESFPSLMMAINFNDITIVDSTNLTFTCKKCEINSCSTVNNSKTYSGSLRPKDLKGFHRLNIPTIGNTFISPDFKSQYNLVCTDSNAQYCFKSNKILACKNDYFWNLGVSDAQTCSKQCTSSYPTYLYQKTNSLANLSAENTNSGYCIGSCDASTDGKITCPTVNLTTNLYGSTLTCNGVNYTKFSIFCLDRTTVNPVTTTGPYTGSLLYSQAFNSPTININLTNALTEYHVEFWFNPDIVFLPKITVSGKYYIFWTNSIRIKKDSKNYKQTVTTNDYHIYNGATTAHIIPTNSMTINIKHGQWIKISYSVVKNGANWDVNYHYQNSSNAGYKATGLTSNPSLSQITFCTNACSSYFGDGAWYSGAYKFLKVWDANMISLDLYRNNDR